MEAANGVLKRPLEQALLVRGNRDFESRGAWQTFVDDVTRKRNAGRGGRVAEDMAAMRELRVAKLPEFVEDQCRVCAWSTVRVKRCAYSVPSRLIGEWVRQAYDAIHTQHQGLKNDLEYLRILQLAASTLESDVELALALMLAEKKNHHGRCREAVGHECDDD